MKIHLDRIIITHGLLYKRACALLKCYAFNQIFWGSVLFKVIFYLWLLSVASLFFIHNPTQGYANTNYVIDSLDSENVLLENKCFNKKDSLKIYCIHDKSILEWQSKEALISWFASVRNLFWALSFITLIAVVTLITFGRLKHQA